MGGLIADRLREADISLPDAPAPAGNYVASVVSGEHIYVAGQICTWNGEPRYLGQLGNGISISDGQKAARLCGLNVLAQLEATLGNLDRIKRCVRLNVFVNSSVSFTDQALVANGTSDLIVEVFGEAGRHARSAVGVTQLPRGACVEVDGIFQIGP